MPRRSPSRSLSPDPKRRKQSHSYSNNRSRSPSPTRYSRQGRRDDRRDARDYRYDDRGSVRDSYRDRDKDRDRDRDRGGRRDRYEDRDSRVRESAARRRSRSRTRSPRPSSVNGKQGATVVSVDTTKTNGTATPAAATPPASAVEDEKLKAKRARLEAWKKEQGAKKALSEAKAKAAALAAGKSVPSTGEYSGTSCWLDRHFTALDLPKLQVQLPPPRPPQRNLVCT